MTLTSKSEYTNLFSVLICMPTKYEKKKLTCYRIKLLIFTEEYRLNGLSLYVLSDGI